VHRAVGQKVVGLQTTVEKSRCGKISFIVKALHESIIVFAVRQCDSMPFYILAESFTEITG
jgi:hypothetical protein